MYVLLQRREPSHRILLSTFPVTAGEVDFFFKTKMLWFLLTLFHKMGIIQWIYYG